MQRIKFSKDQGLAFYKELKQAIDAHFKQNGKHKYGNRKMHFKIGLYFGSVLLFYVLMLQSTTLLAFYAFYLLMGLFVLLTAFNVSHDAAHGVAVRSKFWNRFLFAASFNLQGNNAYVWGKHHNDSHHLYTNIEGSDIDVLHNPLFRMTDTQKLKKFHKYQYIYAPFLYLLYSLNWFFFRESLMLINLSSRTIQIKIPKWEIVKLVFFKLLYIFYMLILPHLLLNVGFGPILLAFILNHFMVSLIFVAVLGVSHLSDYVQHPKANADGTLDMSWPTLQLYTSIDYNPNSTFFNWTLGGFNAHALHHLLPDVCHVHYLELLPIFRALAQKHGLTYMEMDYKEAFASHFRFLKKMGTQEHIQHASYGA